MESPPLPQDTRLDSVQGQECLKKQAFHDESLQK